MTSTTERVEVPSARAGVARWLSQNVVVVVSAILAAVSCLEVPPDAAYRHYFDVRTLVTLFCMLAVVKALQEVHVFGVVAARLVAVFGTRRAVVVTLVWVTLVGSMLITNDMSLIAFLPLAWIVLSSTGNEDLVAYVFILQTAAANLGGMITPFGSPQNLYLYSFYEIPLGTFLGIMAIPFGVSVVAITAMSLVVRNAPMRTHEEPEPLPKGRVACYAVLFVLTVLVVLRVLPLWSGIAVPVGLAVTGWRALVKVDYGLMLTFVMFFIFSGNLSRMPEVHHWLTNLLDGDVLLWSALSSQVISNVPTALLFAQFTPHSAQLLTGVNVGGVGTPVASLASLITLAYFQLHRREQTGRFLRLFLVINLALLVLLTLVSHLAFDLGLVPGAS